MKLEPRKIIFLIIVLAVLATGYWFWQSQSFNNPTPSATPAEPSSEASPDETADWKVFRSEAYGYETKYPLEWDYNTNQKDPGIYWLGHPVNTLEPFWLSIRVFDNPDQLTSKQWVDKILSENQRLVGSGGIQYKERKELTVAGLPADELYGVMAYDRSDEQIYLAKEDKLFYFNFPVADENPNLADPVGNNKKSWLIINTLKFLK